MFIHRYYCIISTKHNMALFILSLFDSQNVDGHFLLLSVFQDQTVYKNDKRISCLKSIHYYTNKSVSQANDNISQGSKKSIQSSTTPVPNSFRNSSGPHVQEKYNKATFITKLTASNSGFIPRLIRACKSSMLFAPLVVNFHLQQTR